MGARCDARMARTFTLLLVAVLLASCSSAESSDATGVIEVPSEPALCAGPGRSATADVRRDQWSAAAERLTAAGDESVEVWVGFSDVVTVQEANDALGDLEPTGVFLAYEEQQGTYAKGYFAPEERGVGLTVEELASRALDRMLASAGEGTPFEPVDPAVRAGQPPIVGVRVEGPGDELAELLSSDACQLYSLALGSTDGPELTTAVEP
jgi:hypothetical protein